MLKYGTMCLGDL